MAVQCTLCLCVISAANGDDGAETGAHLTAWLPRRSRQQWQVKRRPTRARPDGMGREKTSEMTTTTRNGNQPTDTVATSRHHRSRRGVHQPGLDSAAATRILAKIRQLSGDRRLLATYQRSLVDRLLQLRRGRIQQKRQHSQTISQLSAIIHNLQDGGAWPQVPRIASDEIFRDKKTSQRRRASASDSLQQLRRDTGTLKVRTGNRPSIDPMLLMVGIGRK